MILLKKKRMIRILKKNNTIRREEYIKAILKWRKNPYLLKILTKIRKEKINDTDLSTINNYE